MPDTKPKGTSDSDWHRYQSNQRHAKETPITNEEYRESTRNKQWHDVRLMWVPCTVCSRDPYIKCEYCNMFPKSKSGNPGDIHR